MVSGAIGQSGRIGMSTHYRPCVDRRDEMRIEQVMTSLLANAIGIPDGRPDRVALRSDGDVAVLTFIDTGAGISANFCPPYSTSSFRWSTLDRAKVVWGSAWR